MADLTLNIISNMSGATAQVNEFTNAMKRATSAVSSTGAAVKKTGSAVSTAAAHVSKLGQSANKTAGFFGKLNKSLARIAVYRTMRKAISYVGEALKTGLEAAYQFSKANQPAEYAKLAVAMDGIRKAASTMSLQLGAAFGGLITAIAPILIRIINLVTAAAEAITRFFAVLNGTGYYKKAAEGFEEVGASAGGAGKKIKGLLASWDELNVIGKESGGGGGGSSATDYSGAYKWTEAESDWATLFQTGDFFGIGAKIGDALGNILGKFDEWLQKVRELHLGTKLAEIINGFFSDPNLFKNAGETLADTLIVVVEAVGDFLENVNWEYIKNAFVTFAKSFFSRINDELSKPENFGEGPDFKPYWNLLDELWRKDPNNVNPDGSSKKLYDGILEDLERMWEDTKRSFEEAGSMISDVWSSWIQSIKDKFDLGVAWIKDLPTKAKNAGIKIINALAQPILSGINSLIEKYNDSFLATILGKIEPISFELIPEIPVSELNKNYNEAKKAIADRNNQDPITVRVGTEGTIHARENIEKVKTAANSIRKTFTSKFETEGTIHVRDNIGGVEKAAKSVNKKFTSKFETEGTIRVRDNIGAVKKSADGVNKTFTTTVKTSGTTEAAKQVNGLAADIKELPKEKTVNVKANLSNAGEFKKQLQNALKASATIKTTVTGSTKTIGKVSVSEYAQGGWPNIGDLFIANEAGPELVGTIGGSTAVANNDDIVQGIQGGVERANAEQNELLRNIYSGVVKLLEKDLTISPSVALGQVVARSTALYGRA